MPNKVVAWVAVTLGGGKGNSNGGSKAAYLLVGCASCFTLCLMDEWGHKLMQKGKMFQAITTSSLSRGERVIQVGTQFYLGKNCCCI